MYNPDDSRQIPREYSVPLPTMDPRVPLLNLSDVRMRMDSLQHFLSQSVNSNTLISKQQMDMVSAEISSAIHQIMVNGAALLSYSDQPRLAPLPHHHHQQQQLPLQTSISSGPAPAPAPAPEPKKRKHHDEDEEEEEEEEEELKLKEEREEDCGLDCDIVELDAVELLAEHVHFCEICGKGFKRDANLRMHMRAHGNQFKTPEALAKPAADKNNSSEGNSGQKKTRFSCPFEGCNRNKKHKKFRPLKSVICVRNHFKRSHCPKMYSCNRCNKKSFSVVADLKSHLKHCGESRWKCSCGTTFSRKDKLFGHMALFEGHMPAVMGGGGEVEEEKAKGTLASQAAAIDIGDIEMVNGGEFEGINGVLDGEFFEGLLDGFDSIDGYNLQAMLDSPKIGWANGIGAFCGMGQS